MAVQNPKKTLKKAAASQTKKRPSTRQKVQKSLNTPQQTPTVLFEEKKPQLSMGVDTPKQMPVKTNRAANTAQKARKASALPKASKTSDTKSVSFFEWGLLFLGLFCIAAGFGLIIAANWEAIPGFVKIIGGLALLGNGLFGIYWFKEKQKPVLMEMALFFSFLMIGANIALVQQVYHLAIGFSNGALLWSFLSVPFLFLTTRRVLPLAWCALFLFGFYDYLLDLFDIIGYKGVAGFFFLTFLLSYMGEKDFAKMVRGASIVLMVIIAFLGDMGMFSDSFSPMGMLLTIILMGLLTQAKSENKPVRFFNIVLVYVAARVVLLFWAAYASLLQTGLVLIGFGLLMLCIGALYYFKRDKILQLWQKGFNR